MQRFSKILRYILLFASLTVLFILQSIPRFLPSLELGMPLLIIPLMCVSALYEKETVGAIAGLVCGVLFDCYSAEGGIYSTVVLFVCGAACGFLARYVMTENFLSAVTLTAGTLFVYLVGRWLVYRVIYTGIFDLKYISEYTLPTFIYTIVTLVVIYPAVRAVHKKLS